MITIKVIMGEVGGMPDGRTNLEISVRDYGIGIKQEEIL